MPEFFFRVWVHPEDGDPPEIEVWYHGLSPTESGKRCVADWVKESLPNTDFYDMFDLDKDKHWQVVGKGRIEERYDNYHDEYDEDIYFLDFQKAEVPASWFDCDYPID